jgi:hypothetical protein
MYVSDVLAEASALLNDPSQLTWTEASLFPYYKKAHKEIVIAYENNGSPILNEVSAITTVSAGSLTITSITDIRTPIALFERAPDTDDLFVPMLELSWEPETEQTTELRYWIWREAALKFLGATTDREVKVNYIKTVDVPVSVNSVVVIPEAELFLAARTAALAAALSGGNFERASALAEDAEMHKFSLLNNQAQGLQGTPVRKKGYRV